METEVVEVTSYSPRPDEAWRYTDQRGHEHYWRDGYPTLREIVESVETYWCADCHDEHTDTRSHLECPLCGEEIIPGKVGPSPFREFAPGRTSYRLNGAPISEERYRQIIEAARGGAA